jgi:ABC-type transport system substrate-binding protein
MTGPQGNSVIDALERQLQAEWASCGVGLIVRNVSMNSLLKTVLPRGRYQLALAPFVMPAFPTWNAIIYTDPVVPTSTSFPPNLRSDSFGSSSSWLWNMPTPAGTEPGAASLGAVTRDVTGLDDPDVAAYFQRIMSELNTDARALLVTKLDDVLTQDLPTLPLFQQPVSLVQRSDIVNVSESPGPAGPLWDAEDWVVEMASASG